MSQKFKKYDLGDGQLSDRKDEQAMFRSNVYNAPQSDFLRIQPKIDHQRDVSPNSALPG